MKKRSRADLSSNLPIRSDNSSSSREETDAKRLKTGDGKSPRQKSEIQRRAEAWEASQRGKSPVKEALSEEEGEIGEVSEEESEIGEISEKTAFYLQRLQNADRQYKNLLEEVQNANDNAAANGSSQLLKQVSDYEQIIRTLGTGITRDGLLSSPKIIGKLERDQRAVIRNYDEQTDQPNKLLTRIGRTRAIHEEYSKQVNSHLSKESEVEPSQGAGDGPSQRRKSRSDKSPIKTSLPKEGEVIGASSGDKPRLSMKKPEVSGETIESHQLRLQDLDRQYENLVNEGNITAAFRKYSAYEKDVLYIDSCIKRDVILSHDASKSLDTRKKELDAAKVDYDMTLGENGQPEELVDKLVTVFRQAKAVEEECEKILEEVSLSEENKVIESSSPLGHSRDNSGNLTRKPAVAKETVAGYQQGVEGYQQEVQELDEVYLDLTTSLGEKKDNEDRIIVHEGSRLDNRSKRYKVGLDRIVRRTRRDGLLSPDASKSLDTLQTAFRDAREKFNRTRGLDHLRNMIEIAKDMHEVYRGLMGLPAGDTMEVEPSPGAGDDPSRSPRRGQIEESFPEGSEIASSRDRSRFPMKKPEVTKKTVEIYQRRLQDFDRQYENLCEIMKKVDKSNSRAANMRSDLFTVYRAYNENVQEMAHQMEEDGLLSSDAFESLRTLKENLFKADFSYKMTLTKTGQPELVDNLLTMVELAKAIHEKCSEVVAQSFSHMQEEQKIRLENVEKGVSNIEKRLGDIKKGTSKLEATIANLQARKDRYEAVSSRLSQFQRKKDAETAKNAIEAFVDLDDQEEGSEKVQSYQNLKTGIQASIDNINLLFAGIGRNLSTIRNRYEPSEEELKERTDTLERLRTEFTEQKKEFETCLEQIKDEDVTTLQRTEESFSKKENREIRFEVVDEGISSIEGRLGGIEKDTSELEATIANLEKEKGRYEAASSRLLEFQSKGDEVTASNAMEIPEYLEDQKQGSEKIKAYQDLKTRIQTNIDGIDSLFSGIEKNLSTIGNRYEPSEAELKERTDTLERLRTEFTERKKEFETCLEQIKDEDVTTLRDNISFDGKILDEMHEKVGKLLEDLG